jgi:hypothetical protein
MRTGFYMALAATVIVFTVAWAQNYRVLDRVQVGSDTDQATVIFDVLQSRQVTYSFRVQCPNDVALSVGAKEGPNDLVVTRTGKVQDPNGWTSTYEFTFTPSRGTVYIDITATDTTGTCQPTILKGTGLAGLLDPSYDYALARTDPREHQRAVKHTQRYWYVNAMPILYNVRF